MPKTFETPTWLKREACRMYLGYVGMERVVDAVPDDKMDAFADALAEAIAADRDDEDEED